MRRNLEPFRPSPAEPTWHWDALSRRRARGKKLARHFGPRSNICRAPSARSIRRREPPASSRSRSSRFDENPFPFLLQEGGGEGESPLPLSFTWHVAASNGPRMVASAPRALANRLSPV